ncbi:MAG: DUF6259 domain-containing protein [Spirochaetaceae bacterium]
MITEVIFNTEFTIDGDAAFSKEVAVCKITGKGLVNIKVNIPDEALLFWPNRGGELIQSRDINPLLAQKQLLKATICYPSTASMYFFIIYYPNLKTGTVFYSHPDLSGKLALFSLNKTYATPYLNIESQGIELEIKRYNADTFEELTSNILSDYSCPILLPPKVKRSNYQVQLGFISPEGQHNVPSSMGFEVCVDVAKQMNKYIGKHNILHLFAYHGAHDSNYPEYFPSPEIGGAQGLKKAIEGVHEQNQLCSLYMNARLFCVELLDVYPELEDSLIEDSGGNRVIETYYDRDFYVMDPLSEKWGKLLVKRASYLKFLGADIIQLDQVAGRAAIGPIGYKWGLGYRNLIKNIQELGLEVWIQGINEIYPVDRFELCFRQPNILEDGTIRGGHPFGESYALIPRILNTQKFIVPIGSKDLLATVSKENSTIDLEHLPGELSLYSSHYMEQLIINLKEQNLND